MSIPFQNRRPLAVTPHFLEFLDPAGRPLAAWNVEAAGVYSLLVTTGADSTATDCWTASR